MGREQISVGLFCHMLPHYRLPIFQRLAEVEGIDLTVYYSRRASYSLLKTVNPGDKFPNQEIPMKSFKIGGQELILQSQIKKIVASKKHDVVILSGNPRILSNFPALLEAKKKRIGVVWWTLGIMAKQSSITLAIRRWLMHIPEAVLLYTVDERDYFVKQGLCSEAVFASHNTIDVTKEKEAIKSWSNSRLINFISEHKLVDKDVFLYCGLLRERKRIDLLLKAAGMLLKNGRNIHIVIIGEGLAEPHLKSVTSNLGIENNVSWLGPIYEPDKLAPWYLSSKALVIPANLGLAAFQGFAYGLPCITTKNRSEQGPEAIGLKNNYNCIFYQDGDVEDLSQKMEQLLIDENFRKTLSINSKRTVYEDYTPEKMVKGFYDAILFAYECCRERKL